AERVKSACAAAAYFFEQKPWRRLGYEAAIRVDCAALSGGPWYAVVMGQAGMTFGLTLYDDWDFLRRLWAGKIPEAKIASLTVATTVQFVNDAEMPLADLDAAEKHGWPVAGPEAYPWFFRKESGMNMRSPRPEELERLAVGLLAIPRFVAQR